MKTPKIKYRIAALLLALMLLVLVWERQPYRFLAAGWWATRRPTTTQGNRGMLLPWATTTSATS